MDKTVCKNWELNYTCDGCGISIMNATKKFDKCEVCGYSYRVVNKIGTRKELKKNES
jgi:rRNA maturation endonuclease Nob1